MQHLELNKKSQGRLNEGVLSLTPARLHAEQVAPIRVGLSSMFSTVEGILAGKRRVSAESWVLTRYVALGNGLVVGCDNLVLEKVALIDFPICV